MFIVYCLFHGANMERSQGEESLSLVHRCILLPRVKPGREIAKILVFNFTKYLETFCVSQILWDTRKGVDKSILAFTSPSNHLSIHLSINPSIRPSNLLPIYLLISIYLLITIHSCLSTCLFIYPFIPSNIFPKQSFNKHF